MRLGSGRRETLLPRVTGKEERERETMHHQRKGGQRRKLAEVRGSERERERDKCGRRKGDYREEGCGDAACTRKQQSNGDSERIDPAIPRCFSLCLALHLSL